MNISRPIQFSGSLTFSGWTLVRNHQLHLHRVSGRMCLCVDEWVRCIQRHIFWAVLRILWVTTGQEVVCTRQAKPSEAILGSVQKHLTKQSQRNGKRAAERGHQSAVIGLLWKVLESNGRRQKSRKRKKQCESVSVRVRWNRQGVA